MTLTVVLEMSILPLRSVGVTMLRGFCEGRVRHLPSPNPFIGFSFSTKDGKS